MLADDRFRIRLRDKVGDFCPALKFFQIGGNFIDAFCCQFDLKLTRAFKQKRRLLFGEHSILRDPKYQVIKSVAKQSLFEKKIASSLTDPRNDTREPLFR